MHLLIFLLKTILGENFEMILQNPHQAATKITEHLDCSA